MAKIYMYNTMASVYQEVEESQQSRFEEAGYEKVDKLDLIHVYSPSLNQHKTVLRPDVKNWVNRGYYAEPTVVYHPEKGAVTVSAEEAKEMLKDGWYDTPAAFPKADAEAIVERAVKDFKAEEAANGGKAKKPA